MYSLDTNLMQCFGLQTRIQLVPPDDVCQYETRPPNCGLLDKVSQIPLSPFNLNSVPH